MKSDGEHVAAPCVRGVIFDWAGTTVDHGCFAPLIAMVRGFRKNGVEVTIEEARQPMGLHKRDHIRALCHMPSVAARWEAVHGTPPAEQDVDAIFDEFLPLQCEVVSDYAEPIPGCLEILDFLREKQIVVGSSTGYPRVVMDVLLPLAAARGYEPDALVCATDVPQGRPAPWMCFRNAEQLGIYPMDRWIKIGDTVSDVAAGRNAGMWTVAIAASGNALGLSETDLQTVDADDLQRRLQPVRKTFEEAGAHLVIDSIKDVPAAISDIERRLARGERPLCR